MVASSAKGGGGVPVPLRRLLTTKSGSFGTGLTVLKSASAASLAFALADHLGPSRFASLGAVVAVFTVQSSIVSTLGQGLQRVLGNVLGVAIASLWVERVGTSWWSLLIALLVAIEGARRLPLGFAGQAQIPISVLLTVALGPATAGYGHWRVVDTVIGGAVGILVGVGLPERPSFGPARQTQSAWGEALADQLDAIAMELESGERTIGDHHQHDFIESSRALVATVEAGGAATSVAEEGVHFNPRGRRAKAELELLRRRERELTRMTLQVRVLSLTIDQMYDRPAIAPRLPRTLLARLVRSAAQLFRDRRAGMDILAESLAMRADIAHAVQTVTADESDAYAVLDSVSLLGRVEQLRQEITVDTSLGTSSGSPSADQPAPG
jgi:uncharacterized membrane protein YgaE (UPF0421/DUF939 family)